jgi:hypothetical protein
MGDLMPLREKPPMCLIPTAINDCHVALRRRRRHVVPLKERRERLRIEIGFQSGEYRLSHRHVLLDDSE